MPPKPNNRAVTAADRLDDGDDARRAHEIVNLVLAARLRLDAARIAAKSLPEVAPHLAAVDACLDRMVTTARNRSDATR